MRIPTPESTQQTVEWIKHLLCKSLFLVPSKTSCAFGRCVSQFLLRNKGTMHNISRSGGVIQDTDYACVRNQEELKEWENSSDCRKLCYLKIWENNREKLLLSQLRSEEKSFSSTAPAAWGVVIPSGAATVDERPQFQSLGPWKRYQMSNGCQAAAAETQRECHFASVGTTEVMPWGLF